MCRCLRLTFDRDETISDYQIRVLLITSISPRGTFCSLWTCGLLVKRSERSRIDETVNAAHRPGMKIPVVIPIDSLRCKL